MSTPETLCSGCGATVTMYRHMLRDSAGESSCTGSASGLHEVNFTGLPPVAIKPEAAPEVKHSMRDEAIKWLVERKEFANSPLRHRICVLLADFANFIVNKPLESKCECIPCPSCDGEGRVAVKTKQHPTDAMFEEDYESCPECGGSSVSKSCDNCKPVEDVA